MSGTRCANVGCARIRSSPARPSAWSKPSPRSPKVTGRLEPDYDRRIYNASPETLLDVVREADDGAQTILLVGHNPGLLLLLLQLARADNHALRVRIEQGFPTAALAVVELADSWADAGSASGEVVDLILR